MLNEIINSVITVVTPLVKRVSIITNTTELDLTATINPCAFIGWGGTQFDKTSTNVYQASVLCTLIVFLKQPLVLQDDLNNNTLLETLCKSISNIHPKYELDNLDLINKTNNLSVYQINFKVTEILNTK